MKEVNNMHLVDYAMRLNKIIYINNTEIPKIFWKYYDLYRRNKIQIKEFSEKTTLSVEAIMKYLNCI